MQDDSDHDHIIARMLITFDLYLKAPIKQYYSILVLIVHFFRIFLDYVHFSTSLSEVQESSTLFCQQFVK